MTNAPIYTAYMWSNKSGLYTKRVNQSIRTTQVVFSDMQYNRAVLAGISCYLDASRRYHALSPVPYCYYCGDVIGLEGHDAQGLYKGRAVTPCSTIISKVVPILWQKCCITPLLMGSCRRGKQLAFCRVHLAANKSEGTSQPQKGRNCDNNHKDCNFKLQNTKLRIFLSLKL